MKEKEFEKRLNELVASLKNPGVSNVSGKEDKKKLIELAKKIKETHNGLEKSVDQLQESLDYLRISIKYLLFDLEATRRENAQLKKLLEDEKKRNN